MAGSDQPIPLVDLDWQHQQIADEVELGWKGVISESSFILGPAVERFESEFATYNGVRHCIGVGNGTDALEFALRALDIGSGDEVIVPTNSFVASAAAVVRAGAVPVLVDVDPGTHLIDLDQVDAAITPRTRAVMPVHLYGQMVPMEELHDLLDGSEIAVVEDAAQAHGSARHGKRMGQMSDIAASSFYPGKNLGAYGDGGAILTDRDDLAERVRRLRNLGSTVKYRHEDVGFNSRLDSLNAVALSAKLAHLDHWNDLRQEAAARYRSLLEDLPIGFPDLLEGNETNWHLFVIRVSQRDRILQHLARRGIGGGIHYPIPIHRQPAFRDWTSTGDLPIAERLSEEILTLPLFPGITASAQERATAALNEVVT